MNSRTWITERDLNRSLNLTILAVTLGQVFFVVTNGAVFTGFLRMLGVSDFIYGVIMALPVVGGVMQLFVAYALERSGKRKSMFICGGLLQRMIWIPIAFVPVILPESQSALRIALVTMLITVSWASSSILNVTYWSWLGQLVPSNTRGRFFSMRTLISTLSGACAGIIIGFFMDKVSDAVGFALILSTVALFGVADIVVFFWVKEPPMPKTEEKTDFFKLMSEPLKNKNYMRFVMFVSLWCFGINFSGPFFNVYMLENLRMEYLTITLMTQLSANALTILTISQWGKLVDKVGNKPIMNLCAFFIVFIPLIWLFTSPQNYWMLVVNAVLSGITFPGFDMTVMNQSVWLAPEKNRSSYIAVYALATSLIGIALANICGGAFMQATGAMLANINLPFIMGQRLNHYHVLFVLSTLMRLAALLLFMPLYNEDGAKGVREALRAVRKGFWVRKS